MQPTQKPQYVTKTEKYDVSVMGTLLENASKQGIFYAKGQHGKVQRVDLAQYLGTPLKNTGTATVEYELKSGNEVGRYNCSSGHQVFPSTIRNHLAHKHYVDLDMKNAHPTLLLQLCSKLSIEAATLKRYVDEREALLQQATTMTNPECTRAEAKSLFIVLIFGGSVETWARDKLADKELNPDSPLRAFVDEFRREIRLIASQLYTNRALNGYHSRISKKRKATEKEPNPTMRFMSIVVQTIECECLSAVETALERNGRSMDALIFDGGLVQRQNERGLRRTEIEDCERLVMETTGYQIELEIKPLDTSTPLSHLLVKPPTTDVEALEVLHRAAANDWKTVGESLFVFRDGVWKNSENHFMNLIMDHSEKLGGHAQMRGKMRDLTQLAKTRNIVSSSWTQELDRLPAGLVPFANGIYDVATSTLRSSERSDMITVKFDFDAPSPEENVAAEKAKVEEIFERMLPEKRLRHEVMTRLAESFFCGVNTHKYFVQLYGNGNNGKTSLMRLMQTAFPQWVQMPSVDSLVGSSKRDPNAPQPWLIDVMGARILGFEEPQKHSPFNGALLKLLRGNGVVTGRDLHKSNVSYVPTFTLWFAANDLIEIDPADDAVLNSLHSFKMPSYFTDPGTSGPLGTSFTYDKVPELESGFKQREYKLALLDVLRDYYMHYVRHGLPALLSEYSLSRIYREDNPTIYELIESLFDYEEGAKITAKQVFSVMRAHGYKESQKKLTLTMQDHFKDHKIVRTTMPRNVRTWVGLRARDDEVFF